MRRKTAHFYLPSSWYFNSRFLRPGNHIHLIKREWIMYTYEEASWRNLSQKKCSEGEVVLLVKLVTYKICFHNNFISISVPDMLSWCLTILNDYHSACVATGMDGGWNYLMWLRPRDLLFNYTVSRGYCTLQWYVLAIFIARISGVEHSTFSGWSIIQRRGQAIFFYCVFNLFWMLRLN